MEQSFQNVIGAILVLLFKVWAEGPKYSIYSSTVIAGWFRGWSVEVH